MHARFTAPWLLLISMSACAADAHKAHDHGGHHWSAPPAAAQRPNPVASDKASRARGRAAYRAHCASCHGKDGRGGGLGAQELVPRPPDLRASARHHADGDLAWKIANGRGSMPAWQGVLDEKRIWDLVNYLKHLARR